MKKQLRKLNKNSFLAFVFVFGFLNLTMAQNGKFSYQFNTDTDNEGWLPQNSGTFTVSGGTMNVSFVNPYDGVTKARADLKHTDGETIHAGSYPIIAIKFTKPANCNVTFDTNLGAYRAGSNRYNTTYSSDNVYYYDIATYGFGTGSNTPGAGNMVSTTETTAVTTFQFKIADVTSTETGYAVDWIESFANVTDLEAKISGTLGIDDIINKNNAFKLYPNPSTNNSFSIEFGKGYNNSVSSVKIYSILGSLVLDKAINTNTNKITINHNLKSGVYIVKLDDSTSKLIVK